MDHISIDTLRQNARQVVDDARTNYISPYEEWTSSELKELLVQYKIPIRDSVNSTHETLVRICDNVFGDDIAESEKESRGRRYSMEDLARMERSVRVIQKAFIKRQSIKKRKRFLKRQQSFVTKLKRVMEMNIIVVLMIVKKGVLHLNHIMTLIPLMIVTQEVDGIVMRIITRVPSDDNPCYVVLMNRVMIMMKRLTLSGGSRHGSLQRSLRHRIVHIEAGRKWQSMIGHV